MKTGINFERCNVGSAELHNTRDPKYIAAVNASPKKHYSIFEDQTETNVSWVNPEYEGKTLSGLLDELRAIYRERVGQAPQEQDRVREITDKKTGLKKTVTHAGWSPIREGVCPVKSDTTIEDFEPFIEWLKTKGLQVVRIDIHHDEGHTDELSGERKYNHHAHIVVDWIDHNTGKSFKLDKDDMKEAQTKLAASLKMERGESKELTGADHLSAADQRAKAAANKVKELEAKVEQMDDIVQECCDDLQQLGKKTVKAFDEVCKNEAANPTPDEQLARDQLEKESRRDLTPFRGDRAIIETEHSLLLDLILRTQQAIVRIGRRLQDIAKSIPLLPLKNHWMGREAQLRAAEEAANQKAADSMAAAEKARKSAENAESRANSAEARANRAELKAKEREAAADKRETEAQDLLKDLRYQLALARAAGYDSANDEKFKLEERIRKLEKEVKTKDEMVEAAKTGWATGLMNIARALIYKFSEDTVVNVFEKVKLDEVIGRDFWDLAKQQLQEDKMRRQQEKESLSRKEEQAKKEPGRDDNIKSGWSR